MRHTAATCSGSCVAELGRVPCVVDAALFVVPAAVCSSCAEETLDRGQVSVGRDVKCDDAILAHTFTGNAEWSEGVEDTLKITTQTSLAERDHSNGQPTGRLELVHGPQHAVPTRTGDDDVIGRQIASKPRRVVDAVPVASERLGPKALG